MRIEVDKENYATTNLNQAQVNLVKILKSSQIKGHVFHIGQTVNPDRRKYGNPYRKVKVNGKSYDGYTENMFVLYQTSNYVDCQNAERALIKFAGPYNNYQKHHLVLGNEREGGGGRISKTAKAFYVYVCVGG